jgi:hypothetical protein
LAATVRLRIDDERGRSYGTGTIIDVHQDEALVVTCGHIFRDSAGKGSILVDLFHPQSPQPLAGTLVNYDLDRDVGLVSIPLPVPVAPVPVAGVDCRLQPGQSVFSMGCDRGREPSAMEGTLNAVNRYSGPANLSVSGQPVDGRSGGGLFSREGVLIGVCNAADPQDNEGLYAAAGTIHAELDRSGLGFVYRRNGASIANAEPAYLPSARPAGHGASPPALPSPANNAPASAPFPHVHDSEVICIVRSRSNPQATSQVFLLEQPSSDFMVRLAQETAAAEHGGGADQGVAGADRRSRDPGEPLLSSRPPSLVPVVRGQRR